MGTMKTYSRANLLSVFQAKACCYYTQRQAEGALHALTQLQLISWKERRALKTAWEHWRIGEGREELDRTVKALERP